MSLADEVHSLEAELRDAQQSLRELRDEIEGNEIALQELHEQIEKLQDEVEAKPAVAELAEAVHDFLRARGVTEDIPWVCATAAWRADVLLFLGEVLDG